MKRKNGSLVFSIFALSIISSQAKEISVHRAKKLSLRGALDLLAATLHKH
jgi:hypothetical protein